MCVVSHGYDGLGRGRDERGLWYACGTNPGGGRMSEDAGALPECEVIL